jgi:glycerophosphoryl diester phosphodiesterase
MRGRLDALRPGEQDVVLLPEYANVPGLDDVQSARRFAADHGERFLQAVAASSKRLACLIGLAVMTRDGARWRNRTVVFNARGEVACTYDKIHLTDAERNALELTPGDSVKVCDIDGVRFGFATCFDLYFPEHFAMLAMLGADVALCPGYQRSESAERIRLIAQARALDSGAYVVRSSYAMGDPAVGGCSLVAAPTGTLLADAADGEGVITTYLDPHRRFIKPASHGAPLVEHRALIESHRRPASYRSHVEQTRRVATRPFPRLCAHRGLSGACPENTLPAFAAAIAVGAHEIELDVRTSRDGKAVVCHDATVDRTTNGSGEIAAMDWDDICRLDAGTRFGESWRGIRIPAFEQVLDCTDGRIGLNIHVYDIGPAGRTLKSVCDLLHERGIVDMSYLALQSEAAMQCACDYAPDIDRACLVKQNEPSACLAVAKQYDCRRVQFFRVVTSRHIQQAHDMGLICNLFWSDEPADAMSYVQKGIDVVLTNCAGVMMAGGFGGAATGDD